MKDIDEIRRENLRVIELEFGGPAGAAKRLGMSNSQFTNLRDGAKDSKTGKPRGMRKETARKIELAAGKPAGWLDRQMHDATAESNVAQAPTLREQRQIPVVGEVKGGDNGYLDELQYPVGHGDGTVEYPTKDHNAYALRVRGDSMHPRYRAGEFVVVEPNIEAQPGDDVVVALHDGRKLLKELGWFRDGEVQLLSINNTFGPMTIERSSIRSIQLVAGRVRRGAFNRS